ncbi:MAG: McrB family protein [Mucilaginibacter sp.]
MEIWKLGCNWGSDHPTFYDFVKKEQIVLCDDKLRYRPGDLVAVAEGFRIRAIARVISEPVKVTKEPAFERPFEQYKIDYEDWVKYSHAEWFELSRTEELEYEYQVGRTVIKKENLRKQIKSLWDKYVAKVPQEVRVIHAYLVRSMSHRQIQVEILKKEAPANGGGFEAMQILHDYDIPGPKKGILAKRTITEELTHASNQYKQALNLLQQYYPHMMPEQPIVEQKKFDLALNTILYGPPGTGKTYRLGQYQREYFTDKAVTRPGVEVLRDRISRFPFWKVIGAVIYAANKPLAVNEIIDHPVVKAKVNPANRTKPNNLVWADLQAYADDESTQLISKYRRAIKLFHKDKAGKWDIAGEKREEIGNIIDQELLELALHPATEDAVPITLQQRFNFITFHQKYSYEDFIEGIKPLLREDNAEETSSDLQFELKKGIFYQSCLAALSLAGYASFEECYEKGYNHRQQTFRQISGIQQKQFALFIDEINRANISAVFGELITLLEDDKRIGGLQEIWLKLPYSNMKFCVPPNLFVVGTMNTADRSIALLDIALRRRFEFQALYPMYSEGTWWGPILEKLNQSIYMIKKNPDFFIGHAFFMSREENECARIFNMKVIPLLTEYFQNNTELVRKLLNECGVLLKPTGISENFQLIADETV